MNPLLGELKKYGQAKSGALMKKHTTIKIGGPAEYFISVSDSQKLVELLNFLSGEDVRYFILGSGSNVLFPDSGFEGVVINITTNNISVSDEAITVEAGVLLSHLVETAIKNHLTGLEWAVGIPGTVGGAIRGNAGAMGEDIAKTIEQVKIWRDGEVQVLPKEQCEFSYRTSSIKLHGGVVLDAKFKLLAGQPSEILKKIQNNLLHRQTKYPQNPSAGSFFKNIRLENWPGEASVLPQMFRDRGAVPVGWMTESLGIKGLRIGNAGLSEEHGNFIVNLGDARAEEVLQVVEEVKEKVYNKYGVELEPEVEIIK